MQGFAKGLQQAGYATDPHYAQKLVKLAYNIQAGDSGGNTRLIA